MKEGLLKNTSLTELNLYCKKKNKFKKVIQYQMMVVKF
jgi:hypothetical protein